MVSIVIPNYNGIKYIKECLDSIYKQNFNDYEVIVIDNNSSDDDYKWILKYNNIKFKKLDKNYGFSRAVNEGIKLSKGEYVLLLNNDTIMCDNFINNLVKVIDKDPDIFSVCSKMIQNNNRNYIDDAGDEYNILGWAYKEGDSESIQRYCENRKVFSSCAGAAIYRKDVFNKIGLFDENFFAYMEDVDISYRALIYGYKNIYCADAQIYHIGSATSGSKYNKFKVHLAARNNIYVAYKNMPIFQLIINLPFLILGIVIKYIFFITIGFEKEYREGVREAIKNVKNINKESVKSKNLINYLYIELLLIKNTFRYMYKKLKLLFSIQQ